MSFLANIFSYFTLIEVLKLAPFGTLPFFLDHLRHAPSTDEGPLRTMPPQGDVVRSIWSDNLCDSSHALPQQTHQGRQDKYIVPGTCKKIVLITT
jgi:hypothetical protein